MEAHAASESGRSHGRSRGSKNKSKQIGTGRIDATLEQSNEAGDSTSQPAAEEKEKAAVWTAEEVATLVTFLHVNRAASGDSSFRSTMWNAAAALLNESYPKAPAKKALQVQRKYNGGGDAALKTIMGAINNYKNTSGFHWDNNQGANIVRDAVKVVWDAYFEKKPAMQNFCNAGWVYYEKMLEINSSSVAKAALVYSPINTTLTLTHPDITSTSDSGDVVSTSNPGDFSTLVGHNCESSGVTMINPVAGSSTAFTMNASKRKKGSDKEDIQSISYDASGPPTSSAASQASASKKRKGAAVPAMTPSQRVDQIRWQQVMNNQTHMMTSFETASRNVNADPIYEAQTQACAVITSPDSGLTLSLEQKTGLLEGFAANPRWVTSFLGAGSDKELQQMFAERILEDIQKQKQMGV
ncbi:hypothetical protein FIBSPDRAFT_963255 [Athelia psychrophila]|uniref:Myb/SANT-like domain-containing protein n=1 Tax=Athelia psychrophila TaxID=1759441 RepID=A0A165Z602_9AGAM|nr:hypothetical protein FIBSPDRAFT_963255 [Fibularhizoctonia sp. CBS 109695]